MKKLLLTSSVLLFVAFASLFLLTSCDKYKDIFSLKHDNDEKVYDIRIAVSVCPDNTLWKNSILSWAWRAREELEHKNKGVVVDVLLARDEHDQSSQLHTLTRRGRVDALVIMAHEPDQVADTCRDLRRKGTLVIAVHNNIVFPQCPNFFISGDNPKIGEEGARALVNALGGTHGTPQGTILAFSDFSNPAISSRYSAFREVLTQYMKLNVKEANYKDYADNPYDAMVKVCAENSDIDAVWTGWDSILEDVLRACKNSGRDDIKAFVGGNGTQSICRLMLQEEQNRIPMNFTYPPKMIYDAMTLAFEKLASDNRSKLALQPPEIIIIPTESITKDNVKGFLNNPTNF